MRNIVYYDTEGWVESAHVEGITEQHGIFRMKWKAPIFDVSMPNLVEGDRVCAQCASIQQILTNFSKVKYAGWMFFLLDHLTYVKYGFPSLVDADNMFRDCALPAEEIDKILESLPSYTDGPDKHRIGFTGCPGCATCHPEIGRNKGWNVVL